MMTYIRNLLSRADDVSSVFDEMENALEQEINSEPRTLLSANIEHVETLLKTLLKSKNELELDIIALQEKLRQTNISISGFQLALDAFHENNKPRLPRADGGQDIFTKHENIADHEV